MKRESINTMIKIAIIIILGMILLFTGAVLYMTERQLEDEGRMADKYGGRE